MTTIYLPTRKAAAKLDAKEIYVMTKTGLKLPAITKKLNTDNKAFVRMLNSQPLAMDAYWQGKQEFETGICTRD